jgi:hypothetical protein
MSICKYYGEEFDCCKLLSDFSNPMTELRPCEQEGCEYYRPITNYDNITSSVDALAEIMDNYRWCPYFLNSTCDSEIECLECIKEWLQKECDNGK